MSKTIYSSKLHRKESSERQSKATQQLMEDRKLKKGTPQIEICGDLIQEVLLKVIEERIEELVIYLRREKDNEEDDKYRSYAAALRILQ